MFKQKGGQVHRNKIGERITGSLAEEQSLGTAVSWTPTEAGTYDVTAFVWESVENPTALSPTSTMAIVVT